MCNAELDYFLGFSQLLKQILRYAYLKCFLIILVSKNFLFCKIFLLLMMHEASHFMQCGPTFVNHIHLYSLLIITILLFPFMITIVYYPTLDILMSHMLLKLSNFVFAHPLICISKTTSVLTIAYL